MIYILKFDKGQQVFFIYSFSIVSGVIIGILVEDRVDSLGMEIYQILYDLKFTYRGEVYQVTMHEDNLYLTKEELINKL